MSNPNPESQDDVKEPTELLEFHKETLQDLEEVGLEDVEHVLGGFAPKKTGCHPSRG